MSGRFTSEGFEKAIKYYVKKWEILVGLVIVSGCSIFIAMKVVKFDSQIHWFGIPLIHAFKHPNWHGFSLAIIAAGEKVIGVVAFGPIALGLFAVGSFTLGVIVAIGSVSCGIFAIGALSFGVFAVGAGAVGFIAVGAGSVGIVAVGPFAIGIYSLSYQGRGKGKYVFSPHRQDKKAVEFFTRWLPKLKESFPTNS